MKETQGRPWLAQGYPGVGVWGAEETTMTWVEMLRSHSCHLTEGAMGLKEHALHDPSQQLRKIKVRAGESDTKDTEATQQSQTSHCHDLDQEVLMAQGFPSLPSPPPDGFQHPLQPCPEAVQGT